MIKFYYGPDYSHSETYRIIPPPKINITHNNNYVGDSLIGYSYTISINGFATNYIASYDESLLSGEEINSEGNHTITNEEDITIVTESAQIQSLINNNNLQDINSSILKVLYSIELIRQILSRNGSTLRIVDINNNDIIVAKGGILKSLTFEDNENNWVKYCNYSAEIEFNELILLNENISCDSGFISHNSISTSLIDFNQYKVKEFAEDWTFDLEDDASNFVFQSENGSSLNLYNTIINLSYSISATGKDYFIEDDLLPSWLQAKNFCQQRLYNQINNLSTILNLTGSACDAQLSLDTIHTTGNSGLIKDIANNYQLYNESVECATSESDGKFSLNYSAKLKINETSAYGSNQTIHTFTKDNTINFKNNGINKITLSVNGTIEGLCDGGLVKSSGNFRLPNNGTLLIGPSYKSKFNNAINLLPSIINTSQDDLNESFKEAININYETLGLSGVLGNCSGIIRPTSFNLTKNYMEGIITYSAEYTTDRACAVTDANNRSISKTTIDTELPVAQIVEIPIPGGNFLLQDINTVSSRKVTIAVEGRTQIDCCSSINSLITNTIGIDVWDLLPSGIIPPDETGFLLTNKELTKNPTDGSYSVNVAYVCKSGCGVI